MMFLQTSNSDRGFTLIELAVVVSIVGIVAAIALPTFTSLVSRNKLNQSLQQLLGAINEAQRQAIIRGKMCKIEIDVDTNYITASSIGCLLNNRQLDSEIVISTNLPGSVPNISFSHKGSTTKMGTIVLSSNNTNFKNCFVISLGTGIKRTGEYNSDTLSSISSSNCKSR